MSNLVRRTTRAVVRLLSMGLFLGVVGVAVTALAGWTPSFAATTAPMRDVTDHLATEEEELTVFAYEKPAVEAQEAGPLRISEISREVTPEPEVESTANTLGDDPVLDEWWRQCADGSGLACDRLFADAPLGSNYEAFGLSCGDRPNVLHCQEELDGRVFGLVVDGYPLPFAIDIAHVDQIVTDDSQLATD